MIFPPLHRIPKSFFNQLNGELLCSGKIYPFIHSFCEDNIFLFSVPKFSLDAPLLLTEGLLLENIFESIKKLPCGLQWNDYGHKIFLYQIKDDMLGLYLILLEFDSPFIGGRLLFHYGYITIKVMLFKNIQHPILPCVEFGTTFKVVFWLNKVLLDKYTQVDSSQISLVQVDLEQIKYIRHPSFLNHSRYMMKR